MMITGQNQMPPWWGDMWGPLYALWRSVGLPLTLTTGQKEDCLLLDPSRTQVIETAYKGRLLSTLGVLGTLPDPTPWWGLNTKQQSHQGTFLLYCPLQQSLTFLLLIGTPEPDSHRGGFGRCSPWIRREDYCILVLVWGLLSAQLTVTTGVQGEEGKCMSYQTFGRGSESL